MNAVMCLLALIVHCNRVEAFSNEIRFVKSYIRQEQRPTEVLSFWKNRAETNIQWQRELTKAEIPFNKVGDFPRALVPENTLFLANLLDSETPSILKKAERLGLLKSPIRWVLFIDKDEIQRNDEQSANGNLKQNNITIFKTIKINEDDTDSIEAQKGGSTVKEMLYAKIAGKKVANVNYEDFLKNSMSNVTVIVKQLLLNINIRVFSEVMIAVKDRGAFDCKMVYKYRSNLPLIWEPYGVWFTDDSFLDERTHSVTALRRQDLAKTLLTITIVLTNNDSINHLADYVDKHIDPMPKVNYHFTHHIVEFLNATPRTTLTDVWGFRLPNGSFNGLVHELQVGNADMTGSPVMMIEERMGAFEYVLVNSPMKTVFIFRRPPLSTVANLFLLPFSMGVWVSTLLLTVVVSACSCITWIWEDHESNRGQERTLKERVADGILDSLCLVFQQGVQKEPKFGSGRLVLFFGLLSFMFVFTAYSAYIVALLQSSTNSISTLEELLNSGIELGVQDAGYNQILFPKQNEPVRKAIWDRKLANRGEKAFMSLEEGVSLLRKGMFAFHVERTSAYDLVQKTFYEEEKCQFQEIEFLQITYPYFAIARDSPFKELFKIAAKRIMESGLQSRSNSRILTDRPRCVGGDGANFVSVKLVDCAPAVYCLLIGCGLSLILFICELLVHPRLGLTRRNQIEDIIPVQGRDAALDDDFGSRLSEDSISVD